MIDCMHEPSKPQSAPKVYRSLFLISGSLLLFVLGVIFALGDGTATPGSIFILAACVLYAACELRFSIENSSRK